MITLALAMAVSRFAESNIDWFNGYEGIRNVVAERRGAAGIVADRLEREPERRAHEVEHAGIEAPSG
jgi:hypothetical protein